MSESLSKSKTTIFKHMCPILSSANVVRDLKWYEEKTGFKNVFNSLDYNEENSKLDYAVISRDGLFIHLQLHAGTTEDPVYGGSIRIEVENIQPLFEEFLERETIKLESFRKNTPWGTNEFGFYDLNNNAIFFLENVR